MHMHRYQSEALQKVEASYLPVEKSVSIRYSPKKDFHIMSLIPSPCKFNPIYIYVVYVQGYKPSSAVCLHISSVNNMQRRAGTPS